jgi:hypothetical protein
MQKRTVLIVAVVVAAAFLMCVAAHAAATPAPVTYAKGEKVQVEWKGSWWPASVLEVGKDANAGKYKIHYDKYDSSWDEWVGPERMKKK